RKKRAFRRFLRASSAFFASLRWRWLRESAALLLALYLPCLSVFAQQLAPGGATSPEEVALRALVVKYFDAYAKKDVDASMALWSKDAPGGDARRIRLHGRFADEDYQFSEPVISRIKIEDAHASARALIERRVTRFRGSSTMNINSVRSDLSFVK